MIYIYIYLSVNVNNMFKVYKSSKTIEYTFMVIYVNFKIFGDAKIMKKCQFLCTMPTFDSN